MKRASKACLLAAALAGTASVPACLLPDFSVVPAETADGAIPDGATDASTATDADGAVQADGALVCAPNTGDCDNTAANGCETDLRVSTAHCGACGRGCGAAACDNGECKEERLATALPQPFGLELAGPRLVWHERMQINGCRIADCAASKVILVDVNGPSASLPTGQTSPRQIAVDGANFYFSQCPSSSQSDCGIDRCDLAGCKLTGSTPVVAGSTNRRATLVVGGPGAVFSHQGIDGLYRTTLPAGPISYENAKYAIGDQVQAFHADATVVLWLDNNASMANPVGGLFKCPAAGCLGGPPIVRLLPPPVKHLAVHTGVAFSSSGAALNAASILGCEIATGCSSSGTVLAQNQPYVSDIAANADAVYWATVGAADPTTNNTAVGAIFKCARPACAGGPKRIIDGLLNPVSLRVDATHVYWLERGAPASPTGVLQRKRL